MEVEGSLGLNVDKGTPILRQRGKYSSSEEYVYDQDYRDTVWDDVIVSGGGTERYYFVVKNRWDKVKGVKPIAADTSSGRRWEDAKKTDFIAANSILADMIHSGAITADKLSVAGFNFEDNLIWAGDKSINGKGLSIEATNTNRSFKVYNGADSYVEMFQRADEWGLKGKVMGSDVFQLGSTNRIAGWKMASSGFQDDNFKYPIIKGEEGNYVVSGGNGSKLFPNGGIMLISNSSGILSPSSGIMQAGLIKAEGDNAYIMGMEIIAHNNSGYGSLSQVTALKVSAKNDYSSPATPPLAIKAEGDIEHDGAYYDRVYDWYFSDRGSIPSRGSRCVKIIGHTGGNNYCSISTSGVRDGQVITIINGRDSNRLNITNTAMGEHHIRGGCCCTLRYSDGWRPERFE